MSTKTSEQFKAPAPAKKVEQAELEQKPMPEPVDPPAPAGAFSFNIEQPDDVIEPVEEKEENALFNKAINSIKSAFKVDSSTAKIPKRKFFQKKVDMVAKALILLSSGVFPEHWYDTFEVAGETRQLAPTQKHATEILLPLARIADRHVAVGVDNPDFEDLGASVWALTTYILELRSNMKIYQALVQQERAQQNGYQANPDIVTHAGQAVVLDHLI